MTVTTDRTKIARRLEDARIRAKEVMFAYNAGRATSQEYKAARQERDRLQAELDAADRAELEATPEGREELAIRDAINNR